MNISIIINGESPGNEDDEVAYRGGSKMEC